MATPPRANTVSRYLKTRGFTRSRIIPGSTHTPAGYEVFSHDGKTLVTYTLGTRCSHLTNERRRELVSATMHAMEKALSERYTVIMFEPTEGTGYTLTLPGNTVEAAL